MFATTGTGAAPKEPRGGGYVLKGLCSQGVEARGVDEGFRQIGF